MTEKPILFSGPMVRAILDGRKTQTRRVVNLDLAGNLEDGWGNEVQMIETDETPMGGLPVTEFCPYGRVGDRLWVRETWRTSEAWDILKPSEMKTLTPVIYEAGGWINGWPYGYNKGKCRPSIFMPRWASRITLEITAVRVERLQDISGEDALSEGIAHVGRPGLSGYGIEGRSHFRPNVVDAFKDLWDSINADRKDKHGNRMPYGWADNPWVWVVEFRRAA